MIENVFRVESIFLLIFLSNDIWAIAKHRIEQFHRTDCSRALFRFDFLVLRALCADRRNGGNPMCTMAKPWRVHSIHGWDWCAQCAHFCRIWLFSLSFALSIPDCSVSSEQFRSFFSHFLHHRPFFMWPTRDMQRLLLSPCFVFVLSRFVLLVSFFFYCHS